MNHINNKLIYKGHLPVARWYNEISMHDFNQEYQEDTGHFTQIVWKNSREIGFGVAYSDEEIFIVAQYVSLLNFVRIISLILNAKKILQWFFGL